MEVYKNMKIGPLSNHFSFSLTSLLLLFFFLRSVYSLMSLQLPGIGLGSGGPITVDVDFLEKGDTTVYTLKGDIMPDTMGYQADSTFYPDNLVGSQKIISKLRIKAGEIGMTIKLFDSVTAIMPTLLVYMKVGYMMNNNNQPIEFDFLEQSLDSKSDGKETEQANFIWAGRDMNEFNRLGGMRVAKIELHVSRGNPQLFMPVQVFAPMGIDNNGSPAQAMKAVVNSVSGVKSKNVAVMPGQNNAQPAQIYMINPPGAQFPAL